MAAAISCGVLGGGLVGLGTLGFDRAEVAAATCADVPIPAPADDVLATPSADAGTVEAAPDPDLVTGDPVDPELNTTPPEPLPVLEVEPEQVQPMPVEPVAVEGAEAEPTYGTTIAPLIGPKKTDAQEAPCPVPVATEGDAVGVQPGDGVPVTAPLPDAGEPTIDPAPSTTTGPTPEPDSTNDTTSESPFEEADTTGPTTVVPVPTPKATPTPSAAVPAPRTGSGQAPSVLTPALEPVTKIVRGFSLTSPPRTPTPGRTGTISRQQVISRAVSWVNQRVMYSQSRWWRDANGTFRQDCSGYVAMTWRTDQRINYWTGNLGRISDRIASSSMKPGDILLLPGKHVVLFAGWANTAKTRFHLFEEYRTGTPARFVRNASLSYYLDRGYGAYKYRGIRDLIAIPQVLPAPAAPAPRTSTTEPATTAKSGSGAMIELASASTAITPVSTSTGAVVELAVADMLSGLPATDWNPDLAAAYLPEPDLANAGSSDQQTPEAVADVPVDELVAAQAAVDQAESQRLGAASLNATTLTQNTTSGAGYVLAAGLGLLFLAIPLTATARSAMWTATSTCVPVPPRKDAS